jgi:hypothetical protein
MSTTTVVEYTALTAGSTTITPKGKIITFGGKPGTHGVYSTSDADEIAHLDELHNSPTAQVSRTSTTTLDEETKEVVEVKTGEAPKPDPVVAAAAAEAAEATARVTSPAVAAAQEKLATTIAASKAA